MGRWAAPQPARTLPDSWRLALMLRPAQTSAKEHAKAPQQKEHAKAPQQTSAKDHAKHPSSSCSGSRVPSKRPLLRPAAVASPRRRGGCGLGAAGGQRRSEPLVDGDRGPLPAQLILSLINYNLIYNSKEIRQESPPFRRTPHTPRQTQPTKGPMQG